MRKLLGVTFDNNLKFEKYPVKKRTPYMEMANFITEPLFRFSAVATNTMQHTSCINIFYGS